MKEPPVNVGWGISLKQCDKGKYSWLGFWPWAAPFRLTIILNSRVRRHWHAGLPKDPWSVGQGFLGDQYLRCLCGYLPAKGTCWSNPICWTKWPDASVPRSIHPQKQCRAEGRSTQGRYDTGIFSFEPSVCPSAQLLKTKFASGNNSWCLLFAMPSASRAAFKQSLLGHGAFKTAISCAAGNVFQWSCGMARVRAGLWVNRLSVVSGNEVIPYDPCVDDEVTTYFNRRDVQEALHANLTGSLPGPWAGCSRYVRYSQYASTDFWPHACKSHGSHPSSFVGKEQVQRLLHALTQIVGFRNHTLKFSFCHTSTDKSDVSIY